jgi:hypothetical protein
MAAPDFSAVTSLPATASSTTVGTSAVRLNLPKTRAARITLHFVTNAGFYSYSESGVYFKIPADAPYSLTLEGVQELWVKAAVDPTTLYADVSGFAGV